MATNDLSREISTRVLGSIRLSILAILAVHALAHSESSGAQTTLGGVTVYASPYSWNGPQPFYNAPWDPGWNTGAYTEPASYTDPIMSCEDWEAAHPRPENCDEPPGNVVTNGCGPAWFGGYINGPFGAACDTHDVCYSQPNASQSSCDNAFGANMAATCHLLYGCNYDLELHQLVCEGTQAEREGCAEYAGFLSGAVAQFGSYYHGQAQTRAVCRAWYNAREIESDCTGD